MNYDEFSEITRRPEGRTIIEENKIDIPFEAKT